MQLRMKPATALSIECMTECAQFVADGIANMTTVDVKNAVKWIDDDEDFSNGTINVTGTDDSGDQVVCDMDTQQEPEPVPDTELGISGGHETVPQVPDTRSLLAQVAHHEDTELIPESNTAGPLDQELEFLEVEWT